jgi:putative hemolysin
MVERVFRLGDRPVTALMTPRVDLEWLDTTRPLEELRALVGASVHEWFPVASERIDAVRAVVRGKDLWSPQVASSRDLAAAGREPIFVPDSLTAVALLRRFRESRIHVAVVIEEFGGVKGIVTPTDILEALVGELPEQGDTEEPMIVRRQDGSWSVDATTDLDEVKLVLGIEYLEGQKDTYQTIAGYVVDRLGDHPGVGASFVVDDLRFEVLDTDGRRIDRILVEPLAPEPSAPETA